MSHINKLLICYELELKDISESVKFLEAKLNPKETLCLDFEHFERSYEKLNDYSVYCFHLALKEEIHTHQLISHMCREVELEELNPYNYLSKFFDDKYAFASFLQANDFKHPKTFKIDKKDFFFTLNPEIPYYIAKPRHGTESLGFCKANKNDNFRTNPALAKILNYDDAIVQEKIFIQEEYKVLYFFGDLYSDKELSNNARKSVNGLINTLVDYSKSQKKSELPKIFSIDLVENDKADDYILEMNLRPGALYRFKNKL